MSLFGVTFGFGTLSAIIPIFNMEIYIGGVYAKFPHTSVLWLAFIGSLGQNVGKLVWYYVSEGALRIGWLERKLEDPKRRAAIEKWRGQIEGRPVFSGLLTFLSAAIGFPPFFAMAAVAGVLRMNVVVFFFAGLIGRTLFFWALLLGVGAVFRI